MLNTVKGNERPKYYELKKEYYSKLQEILSYQMKE